MFLLSQASLKETTVKLYRSVYGIVFFGVPNDGMDIDHLVAMVGDNGNRFLITSLSRSHSAITTEASRNFPAGLGGDDNSRDSEVYCFYETVESLIPEKASKHQVSGPALFMSSSG